MLVLIICVLISLLSSVISSSSVFTVWVLWVFFISRLVPGMWVILSVCVTNIISITTFSFFCSETIISVMATSMTIFCALSLWNASFFPLMIFCQTASIDLCIVFGSELNPLFFKLLFNYF